MTDDEPKGGIPLVLYRLDQIEKKLDDADKKYVPITIYDLNQKNISDKFGDVIKDAAFEVARLDARVDKLTEATSAVQDAQTAKRSKWFYGFVIGGFTIVGGGVVALIVFAIEAASHLVVTH